MTILVELPPDEERALLEQARLSGHDPAGHVRRILQDHLGSERSEHRDRSSAALAVTLEDLIDHEAIASCMAEADDRISLTELRAGSATIPGSIARAVIEDERAERL